MSDDGHEKASCNMGTMGAMGLRADPHTDPDLRSVRRCDECMGSRARGTGLSV